MQLFHSRLRPLTRYSRSSCHFGCDPRASSTPRGALPRKLNLILSTWATPTTRWTSKKVQQAHQSTEATEEKDLIKDLVVATEREVWAIEIKLEIDKQLLTSSEHRTQLSTN